MTLCHVNKKSWKPKIQSLSKRVRIPNFGKIEKRAVIVVGDPSQTSGDHIWNGAALNLNRRAVLIKIKPKITPEFKECKSFNAPAKNIE